MMSVPCGRCVLYGRMHCDGPVTHSEESFGVWWVWLSVVSDPDIDKTLAREDRRATQNSIHFRTKFLLRDRRISNSDSRLKPGYYCYCSSCPHGCTLVLVSATVVWWRPLRYRSFEVVHHNYLALRIIYSLLFWDALLKIELGLTDRGEGTTIFRSVEINPPKNGVFWRTSRWAFSGHNVTHKWPSPYRAVNTLRLSYTNQSFNAV